MNRKNLLLPLFFLFSISAVNAVDNYPVGARSAGLANASVTLEDIWACFQNQAALARIQKITAGAYFDEHFGITNLGTRGFAFAAPSKTGVFGLSGTVYGFSAYNEKKAGLAYSRSFGQKFSAGIQLDYLNTFIADDYYGSRTAFAIEGGLLAEPIKNFKIGFHISNPTRVKLAEYADERIPTIIRLGTSYKFSEKTLWTIEEEKDIDEHAAFKSGIEYHIIESLYLRAGIGTNPTLSSFGFGLKVKQFMIDAASTYHQVLGFSPAFSLHYEF